MTVMLHDPGDREELVNLVAGEKNARQRDRYRCVLLAMDDLEGDEIAERVGRSPRFVDEWVGRYRGGGIAALAPRKQPGRKPKLTAKQEKKLQSRVWTPVREKPSELSVPVLGSSARFKPDPY